MAKPRFDLKKFQAQKSRGERIHEGKLRDTEKYLEAKARKVSGSLRRRIYNIEHYDYDMEGYTEGLQR